MSLDVDGAPSAIISVGVAVKGGGGGNGGTGSRRAVRWAVKNLMPKADRFVLINVFPTLSSIPTPCISIYTNMVQVIGGGIK